MDTTRPEARPAALGWRLLALVYDLFPAFALALVFGAIETGVGAAFGYPDLSALPWTKPLTLFGVWAFIGGYFVFSWARGGQTLGMRPWRLKVVAADGGRAPRGAVAARYAVATLPAILVVEGVALWPGVAPMLPFWLGGGVALAGLLWAVVDRDGAAVHDRLSGTRFVRLVNAA